MYLSQNKQKNSNFEYKIKKSKGCNNEKKYLFL